MQRGAKLLKGLDQCSRAGGKVDDLVHAVGDLGKELAHALNGITAKELAQLGDGASKIRKRSVGFLKEIGKIFGDHTRAVSLFLVLLQFFSHRSVCFLCIGQHGRKPLCLLGIKPRCFGRFVVQRSKLLHLLPGRAVSAEKSVVLAYNRFGGFLCVGLVAVHNGFYAGVGFQRAVYNVLSGLGDDLLDVLAAIGIFFGGLLGDGRNAVHKLGCGSHQRA